MAADVASPLAAAPSPADDKNAHKAPVVKPEKPEKPDEEQFRKDVESAEKELQKAQERFVRARPVARRALS